VASNGATLPENRTQPLDPRSLTPNRRVLTQPGPIAMGGRRQVFDCCVNKITSDHHAAPWSYGGLGVRFRGYCRRRPDPFGGWLDREADFRNLCAAPSDPRIAAARRLAEEPAAPDMIRRTSDDAGRGASLRGADAPIAHSGLHLLLRHLPLRLALPPSPQ